MEATLTEMQKRGAVQADLNYIQSILIGLKEASISFEPDGNLVFSIAEEKCPGIHLSWLEILVGKFSVPKECNKQRSIILKDNI